MEGYQVDECLSTMTILVDTREQPSARAKRRYAAFTAPYKRQKLDYGDYSASFILNGSETQIKAAIERKMNLDELSGCFTHGRERFKREFERAIQDNASMYLLIEDAELDDLIKGRYNTKFNSNAYLASFTAWIARYNIKPVFCHHDLSGRMIQEILFRELKERLIRGDYDEL